MFGRQKTSLIFIIGCLIVLVKISDCTPVDNDRQLIREFLEDLKRYQYNE